MTDDDKKGSWWPWVLGVVGLFILGALLLPLFSRDQTIPPRPEIGVGGGPGQPITDLFTISDPDNPDTFVGRPVRLTGIPVQEMVNNKVFWISSETGDRTLVVLENNLIDIFSPDTVQPGDKVALLGIVKKVPSEEEMMREWNLDQSQAAALSGQELYLAVQEISREQQS